GINAQAYARRLAANAHLTVDGKPVPLVPVRHELAFPQGQGGLQTTRLEVLLSGPTLRGRSSVAYHDDNYANRIGWSEIVVRSYSGAALAQSSAPTHSISNRLLAYPKNLLQSPLTVNSATSVVEPGSQAGAPPALFSTQLLDQRVGVRAVADSG